MIDGVFSAPASRSSTILATVSAASFLLVPMTPDGPALDPADDVLAGWASPVLGADAPADVADQAAALVERDVVDGRPR